MSDEQDKPIDMPDTLAEAERFKRLFVDPAVTAMGREMKAQLDPVVSGQRKLFATQLAHDKRIHTLETGQKKALVGYAVYASGLSLVLAASWDWIKRKFGILMLVLALSFTAMISIGTAFYEPSYSPVAVNIGIGFNGSGWISGPNQITTCDHVTDGADPAITVIVNGEIRNVRAVENLPGLDAAILTVDGPPMTPLNTRLPVVGEEVILNGYIQDASENLCRITAPGVVIGKEYIVLGPSGNEDGIETQRMFVVDSAAGPGMSGGPIIAKSDGAVVGMVRGYIMSQTLIAGAYLELE